MQYDDRLYETRPLGRAMTPVVRGLMLVTIGVFVVQLICQPHNPHETSWITTAFALNPDMVSRLCVWQLLIPSPG